MKYLLTAFLFFGFAHAHAQKLSVTAFGGIANYSGDLQEKRFTTSQAGYAAGAGVLYELTDKVALRSSVTFGKIKAADALGAKNIDRNLSFSSPITEVQLGAEYSFLNIYDKGFTPYIFGGVSYFHFNPSAIDSSGNKVLLQPLGTEGQGFYDNRKKYKLNQFAIPFGGGVKLALGENIRLGLEVGLRKTFTDYLDDISKTYADQSLLAANNGVKAVEMSFRQNEGKANAVPYPAAGTQRGGEKYKDWYYFSGVTLSFRLHSIFEGGSSKLGCPVNVR